MAVRRPIGPAAMLSRAVAGVYRETVIFVLPGSTNAVGLALDKLILREAGSGLRHCFEESLGRVGLSLADFRVALELGSNEAIKEAVARVPGLKPEEIEDVILG